MNWREWVFGKLTEEASLIAIVPAESVFAGGSLEVAPANKPFVIYRLGDEASAMNDGDRPIASRRDSQFWVYDDPGSYVRIDAYLKELRSVIVGQVAEVGATACEWQGDSQELSDDTFKCGVRYGSFRLIGKVA